ncbi:MAG TPA: hypothetical protein VNO23_07175, partial [Candidatus Binatia bacterium]|nr:hypothetical protein [Candidatus Binatia bacterium]
MAVSTRSLGAALRDLVGAERVTDAPGECEAAAVDGRLGEGLGVVLEALAAARSLDQAGGQRAGGDGRHTQAPAGSAGRV